MLFLKQGGYTVADASLVRTVKDGIEIAAPIIQGVVSALMASLFLRGDTKNKEFELIKAKKFEEAINTLFSNNKITYIELYKCNNFLKIARRADKFIREENSKAKEDDFNIDWFMRFFDAVGNISNEELQDLWGKVLAGEVSNPNHCSLRTLEQIRNLSVSEARSFDALCRLVLTSGDSQFVFPSGFYDEEQSDHECIAIVRGMSLHYGRDIVPMLESGLMTRDHDLAIYLKRGEGLEMHNENVACTITNKQNKELLFQQEAFLLTSSGLELFNIIRQEKSFSQDTEYALACFRYLKKTNKSLDVNIIKF